MPPLRGAPPHRLAEEFWEIPLGLGENLFGPTHLTKSRLCSTEQRITRIEGNEYISIQKDDGYCHRKRRQARLVR